MENKKFSDYENNKSNLMTGTDDCFNEGIKGNCGSKCKVFLEGLCENSCEINKKNKKFSELKVGDDLHIFKYPKEYFKEKILKIQKTKENTVWFITENNSYFVGNLNVDFAVTESYYEIEVFQAIATSMDRLLLELGDE